MVRFIALLSISQFLVIKYKKTLLTSSNQKDKDKRVLQLQDGTTSIKLFPAITGLPGKVITLLSLRFCLLLANF